MTDLDVSLLVGCVIVLLVVFLRIILVLRGGQSARAAPAPQRPIPLGREGNYITLLVSRPPQVVPPPDDATVLAGIPIFQHFDNTEPAVQEAPEWSAANTPVETTTDNSAAPYGRALYIPRSTAVGINEDEKKG